jgi:iron complex transport system substrate-binding protein
VLQPTFEGDHVILSLTRRTGAVAAALLLVLAAAAACGGDDDAPATGSPAASPADATVRPTPASAFPLTFTDSGGTTVTFTEAPKRIISYSPGATEVLFAVGAGGQVVGVDKFSDYPPETNSRTRLEYSKPAPEPALALQPDLVIMASRQEGQVKQFRELGMRVLLLAEPADLAGVLEQIRSLGKLTGHPAEGEKLAGELDQRIRAVQARIASVSQGPLVFFEVSADLYTAAPNTFVGALLTLTKARNIAQGATTQFPQLSAEVVISAGPAVILLADAGETGGQSLDTVKSRPGWANIPAVKNSRVIAVDGNIFSRPGPRVVDALEQLVGILYPDLK